MEQQAVLGCSSSGARQISRWAIRASVAAGEIRRIAGNSNRNRKQEEGAAKARLGIDSGRRAAKKSDDSGASEKEVSAKGGWGWGVVKCKQGCRGGRRIRTSFRCAFTSYPRCYE